MSMSVFLPPWSKYELAYTDTIEQIIQPIKEYFQINAFCYMKVYWNESIIRLTNHRDAALYGNEHNLHNVVEGAPFPVGQRYIFLSDIDPDSEYYQKVVLPISQHFDIHTSIAKVNYHIGSSEIFIFSVPKEIINFEKDFLLHQGQINDFIFYFKNQVQPILEILKKHKQKIKASQTGFNYLAQAIENILSNEKRRSANISIKKPNRFYLETNANPMYLTCKEVDCIQLLIKGYTYSTAADRLGISVRTVHSHLERLKLKFNCKSKNQLIAYFMKNNLLSLLETPELYRIDDFNQSDVPRSFARYILQRYPSLKSTNERLYTLLNQRLIEGSVALSD